MLRHNYFKSLIFIFLVSCKTGTDKDPDISPLSASLTDQPAGPITIGGAYALYPLMQVWADSFCMIHKEVKILISRDGSGEGLNGLKKGRYDLAMISDAVEDTDTTEGLEFLQVCQDAVIPITNLNNPYLDEIQERGITPQQFQYLFTSGERITWGKILDKEYRNDVVICTRYDKSGAADTWAGFFWKTQADLKGLPARGEDEMIKRIQSTSLSLGYCNLINAFDPATKKLLENVAIVPLDIDFDRKAELKDVKEIGLSQFQKFIVQEKYPGLLCRKLSIAVQINKLNPLINTFLVYVLTDGQKMVRLRGYNGLNKIQVRNAYLRLEEANRTLTEENKKQNAKSK
jgi:phosphate transport system substrate-binding protein